MEVKPRVVPSVGGQKDSAASEVVDSGRLLDDFVWLARDLRSIDQRRSLLRIARTWGVWNFCQCGEPHAKLGGQAVQFKGPPTRQITLDPDRPLEEQNWLRRRAASQYVPEFLRIAQQVNAFRALVSVSLAQPVRPTIDQTNSEFARTWRVFWRDESPPSENEARLQRLIWMLNGWRRGAHLSVWLEVAGGYPAARLVALGFADAVIWALMEEVAMELPLGWCPDCGVTWRIRKGRRHLTCLQCRRTKSSGLSHQRARRRARAEQ